MKCHKYNFLVPANDTSALVGFKRLQNRLYIPNKGVLGYDLKEKNPINFFSDTKIAIEQGEQAIKGILTNSNYLGEIDLPNKKINELIASFNTKQQAEETFKEKALSLVSLLK